MTLKGDGHLESKELKHQSLAETSKFLDLETRFGPESRRGILSTEIIPNGFYL